MDTATEWPATRRIPRRLLASLAVLALVLLTAGETLSTPLLRAAGIGTLGTWQPTARSDTFAAPAVGTKPRGGPLPVTTAAISGARLTVPILLYHYVRINPNPRDAVGYGLSVTPTAFAQQMALLHADGATTITMSSLMDALAGRRGLPAHPVLLTFDDGYADFATTAEPVLASYGFVATDYVVSGFIGRPGYMTADQVRAMDAAGMVIGSHTVHHVYLPLMSPSVARDEIDGGLAALTRLLGHPVPDFAYPYGGVNALDQQLVQQAGFRDAVTTAAGDVQLLSSPYLLHRDRIGGSTSLGLFARAAGIPGPR